LEQDVAGIAVLTGSPVIASLIAAGLYTVTYLSFLYLLRYPRNWRSPSLSTSAATGAMAVVTVGFVSLSPDGPDGPGGIDFAVLFFLSGFIALLFLIIAAPAVDFPPGSRPVIEFLANHGDSAGLWMLAPAIVGGYALPDTRLHGFLAAAMLFEAAWYLRHRRNGARRLYPIGDHDLLVLNTQANGDVADFAKQHGIRELELPGDGVGWRGCDKNTLPCHLNLYTNRLGLNTPPCCREHMKDLCHYVASCLREMKVVHWLEGGNLLGAVREDGNLLAWEDDVDISVMLDQRTTWASLARGLADRGMRDGYYVDDFKNLGFITISYDPPRRWPFRWERNRQRGEIRLDLVPYRQAMSHGRAVLERLFSKGAMPLTESRWFGVPEEIVLPTSTVRFLGEDIACPNQPEEYLRIIYGEFEEIKLTYVAAAAAETRRLIDVAPH
jgi:hypothetical protein